MSNFSFSQCFLKACFPGVSKGVIVWEWVKWTLQNVYWKTLWENEQIFSFPTDIFYMLTLYQVTNFWT